MTAALMRQAVAQAAHHAAYRQAFGHRLLDQALMQNVLADLAIESEAATILAMRLARACDLAETNEHENMIKRIGTAIGKYWVTKRGPAHLADTDMREWRARHLVEQMALVFQGALLVQHGNSAVADAFCATRLAGDWGRAFGTKSSPDAMSFVEIELIKINTSTKGVSNTE